MGLFASLGKVFSAFGKAAEVVSDFMSIVHDWVNLGKSVSDNEIDLINKELAVDNKIRTSQLQGKLDEKMKAAGLTA